MGTAHTPPGLPVVGNARRLDADPLRFLLGVQQAYGGRYPLVRVDPPGVPAVNVLTDATVVHDVLGDRERFGRPALGPQADRRQGLLSSEGVLWETQRSVLDPEFVGPRLAAYADVAGAVAEETLSTWPDSGTVDLLEEMSVLTLRVITRSLFSRDTSPERGRAVHEAMQTFGRELEFGLGDVLLPASLQPGPSTAFQEADAVVEGVAREFVDWHRDQEDPPRDVLTALMQAQTDPSVELSEDELVDETVLFLTAGQETTALTVTYALYWLSNNPEHRERLRREAESTLDGAQPGWDDLSDLAHTERVVRETLRLTPAAWTLFREARVPTTVGGVEVEAGEILLASTYAHHRDRRVWDAPETFDPDRWDGEASRSRDAYFPFGSGPRVCIGRQIALTEAQFALAAVLQAYDVDVLLDDLEFRPGVTLQPATPVRARITARDRA
jgi:cytochrome P450